MYTFDKGAYVKVSFASSRGPLTGKIAETSAPDLPGVWIIGISEDGGIVKTTPCYVPFSAVNLIAILDESEVKLTYRAALDQHTDAPRPDVKRGMNQGRVYDCWINCNQGRPMIDEQGLYRLYIKEKTPISGFPPGTKTIRTAEDLWEWLIRARLEICSSAISIQVSRADMCNDYRFEDFKLADAKELYR